MITGFNTDLEHNGETYHIQTQKRGRDSFVIDTYLYKSGRILDSFEVSFEHIKKDDDHVKNVRLLMGKQHKKMIMMLKQGKLPYTRNLFLKAKKLAGSGEHEQALRHLKEALLLSPNDESMLRLKETLNSKIKPAAKPKLKIQVGNRWKYSQNEDSGFSPEELNEEKSPAPETINKNNGILPERMLSGPNAGDEELNGDFLFVYKGKEIKSIEQAADEGLFLFGEMKYQEAVDIWKKALEFDNDNKKILSFIKEAEGALQNQKDHAAKDLGSSGDSGFFNGIPSRISKNKKSIPSETLMFDKREVLEEILVLKANTEKAKDNKKSEDKGKESYTQELETETHDSNEKKLNTSHEECNKTREITKIEKPSVDLVLEKKPEKKEQENQKTAVPGDPVDLNEDDDFFIKALNQTTEKPELKSQNGSIKKEVTSKQQGLTFGIPVFLQQTPEKDKKNAKEERSKPNKIKIAPIIIFSLLIIILVMSGIILSRQKKVSSLLKEAQSLAHDGEVFAALKILDELLEISPNNIEGLRLRAESKFKAGNYTGARDDYYQLNALLRTEDLSVLSSLAEIAAYLRHKEDFEDIAERILLNDDSKDMFIYLIELSIKAEHNDLVMELSKTASEKYSGNQGIIFSTARQFYIKGDYQRALDLFWDLHRNDMGNLDYVYFISRIYFQEEDYLKVLGFLENIPGRGGDHRLLQILGDVYSELKQQDHALRMYNQARETVLGLISEQSGLFDTLAELHNKIGRIWYERAVDSQDRTGIMIRNAMFNFENAVRLKPENAIYLKSLAESYYFKRDLNSALLYYLEALNFDEWNIDIYLTLSDIYYIYLNDLESAYNILNRAFLSGVYDCNLLLRIINLSELLKVEKDIAGRYRAVAGKEKCFE